MDFAKNLGPEPSAEKPGVNPDDLDEIDSLFFDHEDSPIGVVETTPPADVVALVSPKGGTGKTSIAVMLAGYLTTRRRRVGLLDMDPRQGVERWSRAGKGLPFPIYTFKSRRGAVALRKLLRQADKEVDLLIVDTPPAMGPAIPLALKVADVAMIPAGPSALDLEAAQEALQAVTKARQARDGDLPLVTVIPSRQDGRTRLAREFSKRLKTLGAPVTPAVGQRVEVAAAANSGRLVRPSTVAGKEFRRLSRHVLSLLRRIDD